MVGWASFLKKRRVLVCKNERCLEACLGRHLTTEGDTPRRPQCLTTTATVEEAEGIEAQLKAVAALPIPIPTPGPFSLFTASNLSIYVYVKWVYAQIYSLFDHTVNCLFHSAMFHSFCDWSLRLSMLFITVFWLSFFLCR